MVIIN